MGFHKILINRRVKKKGNNIKIANERKKKDGEIKIVKHEKIS